MTHEQLQQKRAQELALKKEWNDNILTLPEGMENFTIMGDNYLVRLKKFEKETTTEYGVLNTKFIETTTDSGRPDARPDDFPFSTESVIVQVSPQLQNPTYKVGDTVWINPQVVRPGNRFLHDRSVPALDWEGILKVREDYIEGIITK